MGIHLNAEVVSNFPKGVSGMSERTAILERRSVVLPSATESEDRTELNEIEPFAEQVEMELGYAGLKNRILAVKETMPDHLSDSAFVDTLSELEMNPFSPESVAEYKKIALADVRKNSAKFSERNARIFGCIARGIIYVMVASVASVLAGPLLGLFWGVAVEMLAVNIFVAMVSIMFFMLLAFSLTNNIEWQKTQK